MFKKQYLALAVLAMTSGAALADNEAYISQDVTTDSATATVEQIGSGQGALTDNFASITQEATISNGTNGSTAQVFQGAVDTQTGVFDSSATSLTSTSVAAQAVTLPVTTTTAQFAGHGTALTNVAYVAQFVGAGVKAQIVQTGGAITPDVQLGNDGTAGQFGLAAAVNTVATSVFTLDTVATAGSALYNDTFLTASAVTLPALGSGVGAGANNSNLAVVDQGDLVVARDGTTDISNGAFAKSAGLFDSIASVAQAGANNSAVLLQGGDAQVASIYQDGNLNDAWIAQVGNVTGATGSTAGSFAAVVQLAAADVATIYQAGTNNTAYIIQH